MSKFHDQPEFAIKFREVSLDPNSYSGDAVDVNVAGLFGALEGEAGSKVSNGLFKAAPGIFVGTGGNLTMLPKGAASISDGGVPGNYVTLKNVPSGSFLPMVTTKILIKDLTYINRGTNLGGLDTVSNPGLNTVAVGSYRSVGTTTSGSGTLLKVNINVYIDSISGTKVGNVVVSSSKHSGYAENDTITVAANWGDDGGDPKTATGPAFTLTIGAANFSTKAATTASDIVIYY